MPVSPGTVSVVYGGGYMHVIWGGGYMPVSPGTGMSMLEAGSIGSLALRTYMRRRRIHFIHIYWLARLGPNILVHTHVHIYIYIYRLAHHVVKPQVEFVEGKHFVALMGGLAGIVLVSVGVV
jgi:hypothetical protein